MAFLSLLFVRILASSYGHLSARGHHPLTLRAAAARASAHSTSALPSYTIHNFTQQLDHFNFETFGTRTSTSTFTQRYLRAADGATTAPTTTTTAQLAPAPIFLFTGAEGGNVENVYQAYGSVILGARALNPRAELIFVEGRFWGDSRPFAAKNDTPGWLPTNSESWVRTGDRVGLLAIEQMLADYAAIISHLRKSIPSCASTCKVVTFGGSLAGSLAAWMRMRYPALVDAAIASSACLHGFAEAINPPVDANAWRARVTTNWKSVGVAVGVPKCPSLIRRGFAALPALTPAEVATIFSTCEEVGNPLLSYSTVQDIVWQRLEGFGEFIYPASRSAKETIGPACQRMKAGTSMRGEGDAAIFAALLADKTAGGACLNLTLHVEQTQAPDVISWLYLACTEVVHPIGANNITDFFPPTPWSMEGLIEECNRDESWNVIPNPTKVVASYGLFPDSKRFVALPGGASRIVFTWGSADPWATMALPSVPINDTGGLTWLNKEAIALVIPGGSHCADVGTPAADDTPAMESARKTTMAQIGKWITL